MTHNTHASECATLYIFFIFAKLLQNAAIDQYSSRGYCEIDTYTFDVAPIVYDFVSIDKCLSIHVLRVKFDFELNTSELHFMRFIEMVHLMGCALLKTGFSVIFFAFFRCFCLALRLSAIVYIYTNWLLA